MGTTEILYCLYSVECVRDNRTVECTHDTNAPAISKESIRLYRRAIRKKKENGSKTHAENIVSPSSSGFSVLFCRLYFAATSDVCLIRSGAAGFQKKLQSQKKNKQGKSRNTAGCGAPHESEILIVDRRNGGKFYNTNQPKTTDQTIQVMSMADMASAAPELRSDDVESLLLSPSSLASAGDRWS